jgi:simple sugar transport system permease protein
VNVNALRFGCVLWSGVTAGAAGVFLAIGHSNTFVEGMTDGRGFIALAVVIFGRWNPWGVLGAALFFGLAQGLQFTFQSRNVGVPYQFFLALPYLVTLAALVLRSGQTRMPAALAQPYQRN